MSIPHHFWSLAIGTALLAPACAQAVDCHVVCAADRNGCLQSEDAAKPVGMTYKLDRCESAQRVATSQASVWYVRNSMLSRKSISPPTQLASVVADADRCGNLLCLFKSSDGHVPGANPMGNQKAVVTPPEVIESGLPYEEVALSTEGLAIDLDSAFEQGTLRLMDASGAPLGAFPSRARQVVVPSTVLQSASGPFSWEWTSPGRAPLRGEFKLARPGTVRRVEAAADEASADNPAPAHRKLALASASLQAGLQWNARKLIRQVERGAQ